MLMTSNPGQEAKWLIRLTEATLVQAKETCDEQVCRRHEFEARPADVIAGQDIERETLQSDLMANTSRAWSHNVLKHWRRLPVFVQGSGTASRMKHAACSKLVGLNHISITQIHMDCYCIYKLNLLRA